jgi:hypothetical protein
MFWLLTLRAVYYSKFESRLRVVRVAVDSGERVVGVRYPEVLIPEVEKLLKDQLVQKRMQRVQAVSFYCDNMIFVL